MKCQVLLPDSPQWTELLSQVDHDFYHLPQYVEICAQQSGGTPLAIVAEEGDQRLLVPLVVRSIPGSEELGGEWLDAASPYGYPCPLLSTAGGAADADFFERAVAAIKAKLGERKIICAFIRLHPLLPLPGDPLAKHGRLVRHGETVAVDLRLSKEELWRQMRPTFRNDVNRAKKNGHVVAMDDDWADLDDFHQAYVETMQRVGAAQSYFFSKDYFRGLHEAMPSTFRLCTVRIGGVVACGGVFSETCGIVQYHLSGSKAEFAKQCPTKLMLDFVRGWAQQRGNTALHLGGGVGAACDALFRFKAGFSHGRAEFHTWRVVTDQDRYSRLIARWEKRAAAVADSPDGFFPAYRKPLPEMQPAAESTEAVPAVPILRKAA